MLKKLIFSAVALLCGITAANAQEMLLLKAGTPIPMVTVSTVTSRIEAIGNSVDLMTTADVVADGVVVIPSGTVVKGWVSDSRKATILGIGGNLSISVMLLTERIFLWPVPMSLPMALTRLYSPLSAECSPSSDSSSRENRHIFLQDLMSRVSSCRIHTYRQLNDSEPILEIQEEICQWRAFRTLLLPNICLSEEDSWHRVLHIP